MVRGKERRYLGHNPAGAAMIVAPAWADDDGDRGEAEGSLKEVHETLANPMLLLVALHVGGVVLASFRHRENLAHAMVTGDKRAPGPGDIA
ncbi:cytochrome b/b6 domain-containing protein [Rhodopseudomonas sp. P2A-2r]|uniref:cytochrome b/b6 domain-containing protein n=1 Tax=Rhodopseudomonas sp. P2A-2r TaxID=2991972 RepID=UPI0022349544|nr:cytochrome b/b6 domain-containing protein [Rhodopseudomonas sp. P2A-2r]UZE47628.1 cytochrome b/b6 domain-containing protein [Rhodopseudomonas sp. P2A-2r]